LVVVFGIFPGLVLDLVNGSVHTVLDDASKGTAVAVPPIVPVAALAIIAAVIVARVLAAANRRAPETGLVPEAAAGGRRWTAPTSSPSCRSPWRSSPPLPVSSSTSESRGGGRSSSPPP